MDLSTENKEILLNEFELVLQKLKENVDLGKKLYYFSALHGIVRHIMNINYDDSLVYLHHILQSTHSAFTNRLNAMMNNAEKPIEITDQMINKLFSLVNELYKHIEKEKDYNSILEKMIVLSYATTGNGFYLYDKGLLKI